MPNKRFLKKNEEMTECYFQSWNNFGGAFFFDFIEEMFETIN